MTDANAELRRAWDNEEFRAAVVAEIARIVDKTGAFDLTDWLDVLAQSAILADDEIVALYTAIRDSTGRLEPEWRPRFEAAFPRIKNRLPPASLESIRNYWSARLFWGILTQNVPDVENAVAVLHQAGVTLRQLGRIAAEESIRAGIPVEVHPDNTVTPALTYLQFAERTGNEQIVSLLAPLMTSSTPEGHQ
jgi:hypothetical protein